jgi:3-deoxy-D-manno-octulosonate 8-phosphate phosphatase KdsC-like HAD superfamily phosphatase
VNLLSNLRDLASTSLALLRVAGAVHRQARAVERVEKHLAALTARLDSLIQVQESRMQLELLKFGADDEALKEEWARVKSGAQAPQTVGDAARETPVMSSGDIPGAVREALHSLVPGSLEDRELTSLMERGGSTAELLDLLAQHGIAGGVFSGALSARQARDLEHELAREEKDQLKAIELAAKELGERSRGELGDTTTDKGDALGGASFGI